MVTINTKLIVFTFMVGAVASLMVGANMFAEHGLKAQNMTTGTTYSDGNMSSKSNTTETSNQTGITSTAN